MGQSIIASFETATCLKVSFELTFMVQSIRISRGGSLSGWACPFELKFMVQPISISRGGSFSGWASP